MTEGRNSCAALPSRRSAKGKCRSRPRVQRISLANFFKLFFISPRQRLRRRRQSGSIIVKWVGEENGPVGGAGVEQRRSLVETEVAVCERLRWHLLRVLIARGEVRKPKCWRRHDRRFRDRVRQHARSTTCAREACAQAVALRGAPTTARHHVAAPHHLPPLHMAYDEHAWNDSHINAFA
jgi:hypothetical protein